MQDLPSYSHRLILFIDFIGFKEHVDRTKSDPRHLGKLVRAMRRIAAIGRDNKEFHASQQVTQFSDCVVVSYEVREESAVFWLLNDIAFCVVDLVEQGFLVRGALTAGDVLHTDELVVGPAMVEAYRLESTVAKHPRILVDESVFEIAAEAPKSGHSIEEELGYVSDFLTADTDGRRYLNYVSWQSVVAVTGGENDLYGGYLEQLSKLIAAGLAHENPKVRGSYIWLYLQYVEALDTFANLPPEHPYRRENWELCEFIEALPRLEALYSKAQEPVDLATGSVGAAG